MTKVPSQLSLSRLCKKTLHWHSSLRNRFIKSYAMHSFDSLCESSDADAWNGWRISKRCIGHLWSILSLFSRPRSPVNQRPYAVGAMSHNLVKVESLCARNTIQHHGICITNQLNSAYNTTAQNGHSHKHASNGVEYICR